MPAESNELRVRAELGKPAVVHDRDAVSAGRGRQPVRDGDEVAFFPPVTGGAR